MPGGCRLYTGCIFERGHPRHPRFNKNVASFVFRHCPDPALPSLLQKKLQEDPYAYLAGNTGIIVIPLDSTKHCNTLEVKVIQSIQPLQNLNPLRGDYTVLYTQKIQECRPSPKRPARGPGGIFYVYQTNDPFLRLWDTIRSPYRQVPTRSLWKNVRKNVWLWRAPIISKRWSVTVYDLRAGEVVLHQDVFKKTASLEIPMSMYDPEDRGKIVYILRYNTGTAFVLYDGKLDW